MKIAVVGSGISGLGASYYLGKRYHVDLYESNTRIGGHTHTHKIQLEREINVDLGSDQTSLHNPWQGGYYPSGYTYQESSELMSKDSDLFCQKVRETIDCGNFLKFFVLLCSAKFSPFIAILGIMF